MLSKYVQLSTFKLIDDVAVWGRASSWGFMMSKHRKRDWLMMSNCGKCSLRFYVVRWVVQFYYYSRCLATSHHVLPISFKGETMISSDEELKELPQSSSPLPSECLKQINYLLKHLSQTFIYPFLPLIPGHSKLPKSASDLWQRWRRRLKHPREYAPVSTGAWHWWFLITKTPYVQMDVVRGGRGLLMGLYIVQWQANFIFWILLSKFSSRT